MLVSILHYTRHFIFCNSHFNFKRISTCNLSQNTSIAQSNHCSMMLSYIFIQFFAEKTFYCELDSFSIQFLNSIHSFILQPVIIKLSTFHYSLYILSPLPAMLLRKWMQIRVRLRKSQLIICKVRSNY